MSDGHIPENSDKPASFPTLDLREFPTLDLGNFMAGMYFPSELTWGELEQKMHYIKLSLNSYFASISNSSIKLDNNAFLSLLQIFPGLLNHSLETVGNLSQRHFLFLNFIDTAIEVLKSNPHVIALSGLLIQTEAKLRELHDLGVILDSELEEDLEALRNIVAASSKVE